MKKVLYMYKLFVSAIALLFTSQSIMASEAVTDDKDTKEITSQESKTEDQKTTDSKEAKEESKAEAPKTEEAKVEEKSVEVPKVDEAKPAAVEAPKTEEQKPAEVEAPKAEAPIPAASAAQPAEKSGGIIKTVKVSEVVDQNPMIIPNCIKEKYMAHAPVQNGKELTVFLIFDEELAKEILAGNAGKVADLIVADSSDELGKVFDRHVRHLVMKAVKNMKPGDKELLQKLLTFQTLDKDKYLEEVGQSDNPKFKEVEMPERDQSLVAIPLTYSNGALESTLSRIKNVSTIKAKLKILAEIEANKKKIADLNNDRKAAVPAAYKDKLATFYKNQEEIAKCEQEIKDLDSKNAEKSKELDKELADKKPELEKLQQTNNDIQAKAELENKNKELEASIETNKAEIEKANQHKSKMQNLLNSMNNRNKRAQNNALADFKKQTGKNLKLNDAKNYCQSQINEQPAKIAKLEEKVNKAKAQVADDKAKIEEITKRLPADAAEAKPKFDALKQEVEKLKAQKAGWEKTYEPAQKGMETYKAANKTLREDEDFADALAQDKIYIRQIDKKTNDGLGKFKQAQTA